MPRLPVVLGYAGDAELVEQRPHLARPPRAPSSKPTPGLRVEVDAQLVGVVGIGRRGRPHVEAEAAEVHRPHDVREVGQRRAPRDVVPFGVLTIVVSSQSGAFSGTRFWKNDEPAGAVAGSAA